MTISSISGNKVLSLPTTVKYSLPPLEFSYNNCRLRVLKGETSPLWVLEDVANLFDVLVCHINKELERSPWVNYRCKIVLDSVEQPLSIWALTDEIFWLLVMSGVGLSKNLPPSVEHRHLIRKWLIFEVCPVLFNAGFYEQPSFPLRSNSSLLAEDFLNDSLEQALRLINELKQLNQRLIGLTRSRQNF